MLLIQRNYQLLQGNDVTGRCFVQGHYSHRWRCMYTNSSFLVRVGFEPASFWSKGPGWDSNLHPSGPKADSLTMSMTDTLNLIDLVMGKQLNIFYPSATHWLFVLVSYLFKYLTTWYLNCPRRWVVTWGERRQRGERCLSQQSLIYWECSHTQCVSHRARGGTPYNTTTHKHTQTHMHTVHSVTVTSKMIDTNKNKDVDNKKSPPHNVVQIDMSLSFCRTKPSLRHKSHCFTEVHVRTTCEEVQVNTSPTDSPQHYLAVSLCAIVAYSRLYRVCDDIKHMMAYQARLIHFFNFDRKLH